MKSYSDIAKELETKTKEFFFNFVSTTIDSSLSGVNGYLDKVSTYYSDKIDSKSQTSYFNEQNIVENNEDMKSSTYYNIKALYETIGGNNKRTDSSKVFNVNSVSDFNNITITNTNSTQLFYNFGFDGGDCIDEVSVKNNYDLYRIFKVVDRGNNDIGTKVLANLTYLYNNLYTEFSGKEVPGQNDKNKSLSNITTGSFQKLFSGLATQSGFLFQQIPNYLNLNGLMPELENPNEAIYEVADHLFGVHTDTSLFGDNLLTKDNTKFGGLFGLPGYIFQLGTISSTLDVPGKNTKNNYSGSFCLDIGYDKNNEISVLNENTPADIEKSSVACFTVDFARQNQQMFTSIDLDTSQFFDTEESINAWVNAVTKSTSTHQTANIFPILEKRSYTCTVSGLGNATIQPLSYFYLRNVPLFHGTYWITNVSHTISPNTMSTTFKGVRQPIAGKRDVRKQLLKLLRDSASEMVVVAKSTKNITEGILDSSGAIKFIPNPEPYGDITQRLSDNTGFQQFNGRNLIAAYIFSITGSNELTYDNMGIVASLYNTSSWFNGGTKDHTKILSGIMGMAVRNMKIALLSGDKRYGNGTELSLSKLVKFEGKPGYEGIDTPLLNFLDSIITESFFVNSMKITNSNVVVFSSQALDSDSNDVLTGDTNNIINWNCNQESAIASDVDLRYTNLFIESGKPLSKANDSYPATNGITLFEIFYQHDPITTKFIDVNELFIFDSSKFFKHLIEKPKTISVKYLGAYGDRKIIFFTTAIDGISGKSIFTDIDKSLYKIDQATGDEIIPSVSPLDTGKKWSRDMDAKEFLNNQILVKNLLKSSGLTQLAAAGVMGNIYKESSFSSKIINKADTNGYPSVGLIQWNGNAHSGSKNAETVLDFVGHTVTDQINYMFKMNTYKKWLRDVVGAKDANEAAYFFARTVEVCADCNKGADIYYNKSKFNPSDRSKYAVEFFDRFNNPQDSLYWG